MNSWWIHIWLTGAAKRELAILCQVFGLSFGRLKNCHFKCHNLHSNCRIANQGWKWVLLRPSTEVAEPHCWKWGPLTTFHQGRTHYTTLIETGVNLVSFQLQEGWNWVLWRTNYNRNWNWSKSSIIPTAGRLELGPLTDPFQPKLKLE